MAQLLVGQLEDADSTFAEGIEVTVGEAPATAINHLSLRASLQMRLGNWDLAADLADQARDMLNASDYDDILIALAVHAVNARIAIQHRNLDLARDSLVRAQLVRPLANFASPSLSVLSLLELSRAYLAISDPAGAQLALREAEQIVRRRPALGTLNNDLAEVQRLLADAKATLVGSSTLTTAELRVLPLLPTYLSFQEIAERLNISRNTVKSHAMSIYGKLWASSRGEAVERAVEIGLLEPYPALARSSGSSRHEPSIADEELEPPLVAGPH
jgi:LuxR family maltose regulon positive regulatory protein